MGSADSNSRNMAHFGQTVIRLRGKLNLSQEELAAAAKLSRATIQNIEKSETRKLRGSSYRRLAEALGLKPFELDREWGDRQAGHFESDIPGTDTGYAIVNALAEELKWKPELLTERLLQWFVLQPLEAKSALLESWAPEQPRLNLADEGVQRDMRQEERERRLLKEEAEAALEAAAAAAANRSRSANLGKKGADVIKPSTEVQGRTPKAKPRKLGRQ